MDGPCTDLGYLGRFCKGDRTRMARYVEMYLQGAPTMFDDLKLKLDSSDNDGLVSVAHSLRPQVNYMGATRLFELLTAIESEARAKDTGACAPMVHECLSMNAAVMSELRAWLTNG